MVHNVSGVGPGDSIRRHQVHPAQIPQPPLIPTSLDAVQANFKGNAPQSERPSTEAINTYPTNSFFVHSGSESMGQANFAAGPNNPHFYSISIGTGINN